MRGIVMTYDERSGEGLISGDDGQRYVLRRAALKRLGPLPAGTPVDFVPHEGQAWEVFPLSAPAAAAGPGPAVGTLPAVYEGQHAVDPANIFSLYGLFWSRFFNVYSRARRAELCSSLVIHIVVFTLLSLWMASLFNDPYDEGGYYGSRGTWQAYQDYADAMEDAAWATSLIGLFMLLTMIPSLTQTIRRLHDVGWSGWTLLIPFLIWVLGFSFASGREFGAASAASVLWVLVLLVYLIVLLFVPGNRGSNRFGPDPRGG